MNSLPVELISYINLNNRTDRREHMEKQLEICSEPVLRVTATRLDRSPSELGLKMKPGLEKATGVASIFKSHLNALRQASALVNDGAFILLEDDCIIDPRVWKTNLNINSIDNWDIIMLSPRYRYKHKQPEGAPKFSKNPFGTSPILLKSVRKDYNCTGAHFCIFNGLKSIDKAIRILSGIEEIRDIDNVYAFDLTSYGISTPLISAGGFSSDHGAVL